MIMIQAFGLPIINFPTFIIMLRIVLFIGIGGFIGSVGRYYLASWVQGRVLSNWPYGTFIVNLLGCILIGIFFTIADRTLLSPEWRLALITGLCGGLTTFSSFSFEIINLLRGGQFAYALSYIFFSLLLGLFGVWAGMQLARIFY